MSEILLDVFEGFCDELPETVREDLQFMIVMLSDEDFMVDELGSLTNGLARCSGRKPSSAEWAI